MDQTRPLIGVLDHEPKLCGALVRLLKTRGFDDRACGSYASLIQSAATI